MSDQPLYLVELLEVPVPLRKRSQEHSDELLREMTLVALHDPDGQELPIRLTQLAADVRLNFGAITSQQESDVDAASARGETVLPRLAYHVPASVAAYCTHLIDILEETEEYCRAGTYLLALASPPDILAYRNWALVEFARQIDGLAPTPWPVYATEHGLV